MQTSENGINLIKEMEGFRSKAYQCEAHKWTIGYGHTRGVKAKDVVTEQQALDILIEDIRTFEPAVMDLLRRSPEVYIDGRKIDRQFQFDALVSFTFNCGTSAIRRTGLARAIEDGLPEHMVRAQFERWVYVDGKPLPGLVHRRLLESDLYFGIVHL